MTPVELVPILIFLSVAAAVLALASLATPSRNRVAERIRQMAGAEVPRAEAGPIGLLLRGALARATTPLLPSDGQRRDRLRLRLVHAGYYNPQAISVLLLVRFVLILVPLAAAGIAVLAQLLELEVAAVGGGILATLGMIAPGFWLDTRKKSRQNELRRGLPDFFDVIVLCVESGMSLTAAWRRVANELERAYPALWKELKLVEQEMEIGRLMGDALNKFAERTDLDEVLSLAAVVGQAERLGTELARPLRTLSDTLRQRRVQKAEETAHKTATKIMFPTLLFIFPGVFAIILGPMIIQVMNIFSGGK
jgi:tight adherence protein C